MKLQIVLMLQLISLPLLALECAQVPNTTGMAALPGCIHGLPVRQGELILVPRACRLTVAGKTVDRQSVDIRHGETGARVGQASLPPTPPGPEPAQPGTILPGEPPLLVTNQGIAAIDPRAGQAEPTFEPQGKLLAVARKNDVLLVVEVQSADKTFPGGSLAVTAIDQEAGEVLGDLQLAGITLEILQLRAGKGKSLEAVLTRLNKEQKREELVIPLRDEAGKSVVKKAQLAGKLQPASPPPPFTPTCPVLPAPDRVLLEKPWILLEDSRQTLHLPGGFQGAKVAGQNCVTVSALNDKQTGMAWVLTANKAQLLPVKCQ